MRQAWILAALAAGCAAAAPSPAPVPPAEAPAIPGRAGLEIPPDLWDLAREGLGRPGARLGYDSDQMAFYTGGRKHVLPAVDNLFRDARNLPRFSGSLADRLVAAAARPDEVVQIAYGLTDAVAGRMLPLPDVKGWGIQGIEIIEGVQDDSPPEKVLDALVAVSTSNRRTLNRGGMEAEDRAAFLSLPPEVQRLVVRLLLARAEAYPWMDRAFGKVGGAEKDPYALAVAPLVEERMGQMVCLREESLAALDAADRKYLAFGSVLALARVQQALEEYRNAEKHPVPAGFERLLLFTHWGNISIMGTGDDVRSGLSEILLDLGGNDRWSFGPKGRHVVQFAVDLGGDDAWDDGGHPGTLACGLFGIGAVFDMAGNDTYRSKESGLGCAWFGTGLLFDAAGNDVYETATHWGQGCGYAGVGALIDLAGDDRYVIGYEGQGYGATLGAGILLDVSGNDTYLARDDGNRSDLYLGQTVSMAQGVGQGRRADLGDGHSMAGGFGVLVDGAGDDSYRAGAWSHGAGYWWACGILEDLGGDDTYHDGKYSLGAAAHFALGVQVDLSGDDAYNVGNDTAVNQYQGHARDGSIGVSVDGDGNDRYHLRSHCGGSADLGSIAVLYDRRGDDLYDATSLRTGEGEGWPDTPPLGTSTRYDPMRSFRDDLDTLGVFLDGGGRDEYRGGPGEWGNGRTWTCRRGPRFLGVAVDRD